MIARGCGVTGAPNTQRPANKRESIVALNGTAGAACFCLVGAVSAGVCAQRNRVGDSPPGVMTDPLGRCSIGSRHGC
jgi:hypothetical protein